MIRRHVGDAMRRRELQLAEQAAKSDVLLARQRLPAEQQHAVIDKCGMDFAKSGVIHRFAQINTGDFRTQRV